MTGTRPQWSDRVVRLTVPFESACVSCIKIKYYTVTMSLKLNIIVAVCENMGIGMNGDLPWRLRYIF